MKLKMISLYDTKAEAYNAPQFVQSIGGAIRGFSDEINRADAGNVLYNHPEHFVLYELGEYDDQDGSIELLALYRVIAVGADLKQG